MHKARFLLVLGFALLLLLPAVVSAKPQADGSLDPSFGSGGMVHFPVSGGVDAARAIARSGDKFVLAGYAGGDFALVRFDAQGRLDESFGGDPIRPGRVLTDFGGDDAASALVAQPDGKVVAAGVGGGKPTLARYDAAGALDTSFGISGTVVISATSGEARSLVLLGDGKLLLAGSADGRLALLRLLPDGTLDTTFNAAATTPPLASAADMALTHDGKIVVVGQLACPDANPCGPGYAVAQFNPDGTVDEAFGVNGVVGGIGGIAHALAIGPSGTIVVVGAVSYEDDKYSLLAINADGSPDEEFGTDGYLEEAPAAYRVSINDVAFDSAGGIILTGWVKIDEITELTVAARLLADGSADSTFGSRASDGILHYYGGWDGDEGNALYMAPNGAIYIAGMDSFETSLRRLSAVGLLDTTFGAEGYAFTDFIKAPPATTIVKTQAEDKILLAGYTPLVAQPDGSARPLLRRFAPDGTPETSFSAEYSVGYDPLTALLVKPNGEFLVGTTHDARILLFDSATQRVGEAHAVADRDPGEVTDLALGTDGRVIAAATDYDWSQGSAYPNLVISAQHVSATPGGSDFTVLYGDRGYTRSLGLSVQADGKIVALLDGGYKAGIIRLQPDGQLDHSFNFDGERAIGPAANFAHGIVVDTYGRISYATTSTDTFSLTRLSADGSLDNSFGVSGTVSTTVSGPVVARSLSSQPDGKLIIAGNAGSKLVLLRYNADGSVDQSFGTNGVVLGEYAEPAGATSVTVQSNGRLIVSGYIGDDFTLFGYTNTIGSPPPTIPPPTQVPCIFSDVCTSDYFYAPVADLVARGALSGYADGTYRPNNYVTRGQLAKIVVAAEGWATSTGGRQQFSDVPPDNTFFRYVNALYEHHAVSGYADGTFRPFNYISREQLSKVLVIAQGWDLSYGCTVFIDVTCDDNNPIGHYIYALRDHSAISGYADGTFRPYSPATRGQLAKIIYVALNNSAK